MLSSGNVTKLTSLSTRIRHGQKNHVVTSKTASKKTCGPDVYELFYGGQVFRLIFLAGQTCIDQI